MQYFSSSQNKPRRTLVTWYVTPCHLLDISSGFEEPTVSIFRVPSKMLVNFYQTIRRHIPSDWYVQPPSASNRNCLNHYAR